MIYGRKRRRQVAEKRVKKQQRRRFLSLFMVLCLVFTYSGGYALANGTAPINLSELKPGEIGAVADNIQMIECGHEFSFDLTLDAAFNKAVLDTTSKNPYDVVLVLDRSGSMSSDKPSKWTDAKNAAKAVIDVVNDYNKGTGAFAGTGALEAGNRSTFGLVSYADAVTSMKGTTTGSGDSRRFNVSSGTGDLIDPTGAASGSGETSNANLAKNAIDNLSSTGYTNIADAIRDAQAMLDARANKSRPGFIIVMSDGVANRPYNHNNGTVPAGDYTRSGSSSSNYVYTYTGTGTAQYQVTEVSSGGTRANRTGTAPNYTYTVNSNGAYRINVTQPTTTSPNHTAAVINGVRIADALAALGVDVTSTSHQCNQSEPSTHTCSTAAAVLRADAAREAGYTIFAVGFDLSNISNESARSVGQETLRMIAGEPRTGDLSENPQYFAAGLSNEALKKVFTNIVESNITIEVNPVATDGLVKYNAPSGFTIEKVEIPATAGGLVMADPVIAADKKSFTLAIDEIYAKPGKISVTIKAADTAAPGAYTVMGAGSKYEFTNVELNVLKNDPAWYTSGAGEFDFYIDLAVWANADITVLPLAKNTTASVTILPGDTTFEIKLSDLSDAPYPEGGALSGSGNVMSGGSKIGSFITDGGVIKVTLDSLLTDSVTATLEYTYTSGNLTSCKKTLTIAVNLKDTFKVTVNYWIKEGPGYTKLNSRTVVKDGYLAGEDYTFANIGAAVPDYIQVRQSAYYFDYGVNKNTGDSIVYANDYAELEGKIIDKDVVIDLKYSKLTLPEIPLKKFVEKEYTDATYPANYSFTFALYISDGGYKQVTNDLAFTKSEIESGATKHFVWNLPSGMSAADLRGKTLYIKEVKETNWSSAAMDAYKAYGTLTSLVGFQPATEFASGNITNYYDQPRDPATVRLLKFFSGDAGGLIPEFDGAVRACGETEREASTIDVWVPCMEGCEAGNCVLGEDCDGDDETQTVPGHTHTNYCYAYEFTFEMFNGGDLMAEQKITISYERIKQLLENPYDYEEAVFDIAVSSLPAKGSGNVLALSIVEKSNNYGWVAAAEAGGIVVDAYGKVTYPAINGQAVDYVEMKNVFGGIKVPGFSFAKTVVDARSILGASIASYYTGEFTFELRHADGGYIDEVTIPVINGIASYTFKLTQFIGGTVDLKLVEKVPDTKVEGMTYDSREFLISIEDGVVTKVNPAGRYDKTPIVFVNTLLTPITPKVIVEKLVGDEGRVAAFTFNWSYEGFENVDLLSPVAKSGSGSASITVNSSTANFFEITLPVNFTGRLTITEVKDNTMTNWEFDNNSTRTIDYVLGKPVGRNASNEVSFTNNYSEAGIELIKTADENQVLLGSDITYRIRVENTGAEDLKNVVITDEMFNGTVKIQKPQAGSDPDPELEKGADYLLDLDEGTITLTGGLKQGEKVFITYTVYANETGKIENLAAVEAERTVTVGGKVTDEDDETVTVIRYNSKLDVKKHVAAYTAGMDFTGAGVTWSKSITFSSAGNKAVFRVTIKNTGEGVIYVTNITDVFAKVDLSGAEFYYNNVKYTGIPALLAAISGVGLTSGAEGNEIVFYFITDTLNTRDTYGNIVTVTAVDQYEDQLPAAEDKADVILSWDDGPDPDLPRPRPGPGPTPAIIPDPEVPLAVLPRDEQMTIFEEDVPLGDAPQTGIGVGVASFILFGLSLSGLFAARGMRSGRRKMKEFVI